MEEEGSELRDQALQRIGRNVVNFQRIEMALKSLIVAANFQGHASDLSEILRKSRERVDKQTMGWLVGEFLSIVYANDLPSHGPSSGDGPSSQIWVSFSLRVERDDNAA